MRIATALPPLVAGWTMALALALAAGSAAQATRTETVAAAAAAAGTILKGELKGDDSIEYVIVAEAG